jgi:hypothetical protein
MAARVLLPAAEVGACKVKLSADGRQAHVLLESGAWITFSSPVDARDLELAVGQARELLEARDAVSASACTSAVAL